MLNRARVLLPKRVIGSCENSVYSASISTVGFWPVSDRCSGKPSLSFHTWRTCHEHHRYPQPSSLEQRKIGRAQTPATTERYLVYPGKASNSRKNSGSCSLRSGHRQQTSSLRLKPSSVCATSPTASTYHHEPWSCSRKRSGLCSSRLLNKHGLLSQPGYVRPSYAARTACSLSSVPIRSSAARAALDLIGTANVESNTGRPQHCPQLKNRE